MTTERLLPARGGERGLGPRVRIGRSEDRNDCRCRNPTAGGRKVLKVWREEGGQRYLTCPGRAAWGRFGDIRAPSALPCAGPGRTVVLRLLRRRGLAHLHPEDAQEDEQQPQAGPEQEP